MKISPDFEHELETRLADKVDNINIFPGQILPEEIVDFVVGEIQKKPKKATEILNATRTLATTRLNHVHVHEAGISRTISNTMEAIAVKLAKYLIPSPENPPSPQS